MIRAVVRPGRWWRAIGLAVALVAVLAGPAAADPPGPTRYETSIVGIEPAVDGVDAAVIGGDAYLQLTVAAGHEVVVPGYDTDELYLRFDVDGSVYENVRSRAYHLNQARYGAEVPGDVGPDIPPEWVRVSSDGTFAWHDHRIHWMSPQQLPFRADTGAFVDPGTDEPQLTTVFSEPVLIRVDGEPVDVLADVYYLPTASPLPAVAAFIVALGAVVAVGLRRTTTGILAGVVAGGVVAVAVSVPTVIGLPTGVSAQPFQLLVPAIGVGVMAAGLGVRGRSAFALAVAGAGGIPLLLWAITNIGALSAPIVPPTSVPADLVRLTVGATAGAGIAAFVLGVRDLLTADTLSLDPDPA